MEPAPALLVVAGAWDTAARDFVARNASAGVALLLPRDLSRPGWRFRFADPSATVVVVGDRHFPLHDVGGVLIRLPAVTEPDLPHIASEDRTYVAAELTAFLLAVLTLGDVPVMNRPTPQCLCGPVWHDAKWRLAAARLGLPVTVLERHAAVGAGSDDAAAAVASVTIVGETCIGAPNASLEVASRALAEMAGAEMLTVEFDGSAPTSAVLRADPRVNPDDPLIELALLRRFGVMPRPLRQRA
jgi:hypothetical protein